MMNMGGGHHILRTTPFGLMQDGAVKAGKLDADRVALLPAVREDVGMTPFDLMRLSVHLRFAQGPNLRRTLWFTFLKPLPV